ncbi:hypothetical protein TNCV_4559221 [Trichonephila clavipes]|nr:hypothetical protein TNCV_4559221 [Trichonephila clavipes]
MIWADVMLDRRKEFLAFQRDTLTVLRSRDDILKPIRELLMGVDEEIVWAFYRTTDWYSTQVDCFALYVQFTCNTFFQWDNTGPNVSRRTLSSLNEIYILLRPGVSLDFSSIQIRAFVRRVLHRAPQVHTVDELISVVKSCLVINSDSMNHHLKYVLQP